MNWVFIPVCFCQYLMVEKHQNVMDQPTALIIPLSFSNTDPREPSGLRPRSSLHIDPACTLCAAWVFYYFWQSSTNTSGQRIKSGWRYGCQGRRGEGGEGGGQHPSSSITSCLSWGGAEQHWPGCSWTLTPETRSLQSIRAVEAAVRALKVHSLMFDDVNSGFWSQLNSLCFSGYTMGFMNDPFICIW